MLPTIAREAGSALPRPKVAGGLAWALSVASSAALLAQPAQAPSLSEQYRDTAGRILGAALTDVEGWEKLSYLTTHIGHRLSGSQQLERAIAWAATTMREEGLENVTEQPVQVPHWVRGDESLDVVRDVGDPHRRSDGCHSNQTELGVGSAFIH